MTKITRAAKIEDVLSKIRDKASRGVYVPVDHAKERMNQREVSDPEVRYILEHGYRESKKDEYKQEHRAWSYSMRGKTVDGRPLRIVVSFDADDLLIITVNDLEG